MSRELKVLLQLIAEFGEGLSDKDLDFLIKLKFASTIVPPNWRRLFLDELNSKEETLSVCRHYYFDITKKYGSKLLQIKVNLRRFGELEEGNEDLRRQLRLRALQYLSVYTLVLLERYSKDYQEHLFEYTNVSHTGIFYYRKWNRHTGIFESRD